MAIIWIDSMLIDAFIALQGIKVYRFRTQLWSRRTESYAASRNSRSLLSVKTEGCHCKLDYSLFSTCVLHVLYWVVVPWQFPRLWLFCLYTSSTYLGGLGVLSNTTKCVSTKLSRTFHQNYMRSGWHYTSQGRSAKKFVTNDLRLWYLSLSQYNLPTMVFSDPDFRDNYV